MKMMDVGNVMDTKDMNSPAEEKSKMMYPNLHFNHKIPDVLKQKDVGDMCHLEIMGKIVSKSESDTSEDMTIEVHKIGYKGKNASEDEYKKMSNEEKDKIDEEDVME